MHPPSSDTLQHALDFYVDNEGIFNFGLLPPGAAERTPGDRLDRAWTAYWQAAIRFKHEVLRTRGATGDLQDWWHRLDAESPHREEMEYESAYFDACPTALDQRVAFVECRINQQIVHTWRTYARCCIFLNEESLGVMKRHIGFLRYEEDQLRIIEFLRWRALRIIARFVKTHPRFPKPVRIRAPPTCTLCAERATHVFKYNWGSDRMCRSCYSASMEEMEEALRHNAWRGWCSDCDSDCSEGKRPTHR